MILMREEKSKFLNFIFQEADGDDEPSAKNRKVVTVKKKAGRKVDYSKGADLGLNDDESSETEDNDNSSSEDISDGGSGEDDGPTMDDTDYSDDGDGSDDNSEGNSSDDSGNDASDEPVMDDTDYADDDSGDNSSDSDGGSGEDDGPTMDDTDYSDDGDGSDDNSEGNSSDDSGNDASDDNNGNSQSSADEQARKYSLYRKFVKLNNLLESNTEVLSNTMFDDTEINQKIKSVTAKLKETNRLLSEYMVVKFQTASYIQSMLFYQRVLAIIDINFNILQDLKKQINKKR